MTLKQAKAKAAENHALAEKSGVHLAAEYWAGVYLGLILSPSGIQQWVHENPEFLKAVRIGLALKATIA